MDNDNKQLNIHLSGLSIFRDNPSLEYVYKKAEKIISAIYMLSSFISDKEPMRTSLRSAANNLLSSSLSLSDRINFIKTGLECLSFLEASYVGGLISEMNYKILKFELESLIQTSELSDKGNGSKGLLFPEHFFTIPASPVLPTVKAEIHSSLIPKVKNIMSDRVSDRKEIILSLLKKTPNLGIKDFVSAVSGCSEKTIQRELAALVSKGLIKKEGEKRWSRYSLR